MPSRPFSHPKICLGPSQVQRPHRRSLAVAKLRQQSGSLSHSERKRKTVWFGPILEPTNAHQVHCWEAIWHLARSTRRMGSKAPATQNPKANWPGGTVLSLLVFHWYCASVGPLHSKVRIGCCIRDTHRNKRFGRSPTTFGLTDKRGPFAQNRRRKTHCQRLPGASR